MNEIFGFGHCVFCSFNFEHENNFSRHDRKISRDEHFFLPLFFGFKLKVNHSCCCFGPVDFGPVEYFSPEIFFLFWFRDLYSPTKNIQNISKGPKNNRTNTKIAHAPSAFRFKTATKRSYRRFHGA